MTRHVFHGSLPDGVECIGALDFDYEPTGMRPRRLPDWTRPQVPQGLDVMLRMPSGVRLQFRTDSSTVGLELLVTSMGFARTKEMHVPLNLEWSGQVVRGNATKGNAIVPDSESPAGFRVERGDADTVWFRGLGNKWKDVAIWLPHNTFVELRGIHINDGAGISAYNDTRPKWVHYGSSISHCMEAREPAFTWPALASRLANLSLVNLGVGGQCHLDPFVARTIRDLNADLISIKTGINIINMDSMKDRVFTPLLHGFLDTIREKHEETPIILVSPIYCPSAETRPGPTIPNELGKFVTIEGLEAIRHGCMSLERVRELIRSVVDVRKQHGDQNLYYFDGLTLFGEQDAPDLPDDLHPNPEGYIRMGERFAAQALPMVL